MGSNETLDRAYGQCPKDVPTGTEPVDELDVWCGHVDVMYAAAWIGFLLCMVLA